MTLKNNFKQILKNNLKYKLDNYLSKKIINYLNKNIINSDTKEDNIITNNNTIVSYNKNRDYCSFEQYESETNLNQIIDLHLKICNIHCNKIFDILIKRLINIHLENNNIIINIIVSLMSIILDLNIFNKQRWYLKNKSINNINLTIQALNNDINNLITNTKYLTNEDIDNIIFFMKITSESVSILMTELNLFMNNKSFNFEILNNVEQELSSADKTNISLQSLVNKTFEFIDNFNFEGDNKKHIDIVNLKNKVYSDINEIQQFINDRFIDAQKYSVLLCNEDINSVNYRDFKVNLKSATEDVIEFSISSVKKMLELLVQIKTIENKNKNKDINLFNINDLYTNILTFGL